VRRQARGGARLERRVERGVWLQQAAGEVAIDRGPAVAVRSPGHAAIVAPATQSGRMRILEPVFGTLARWGRRKGVERALIARYCAW
jgi:hypothetical protein